MPVSTAVPAQVEPSAVESGIRVEVISEYRDFLALESLWDSVLQLVRHEDRHPFLEFSWARAWWDHFGGSDTLYILVVWRDGKPLGVAPLMLSRVRICGIPLRRLGFLYNAHVPRTGFVIGMHSEDVYRAIWTHLQQHRNWDLLQLCQLIEASPEFQTIRSLANECGLATGTWASGASPYIAISGTYSDYFSSLPAKHRSNLRNRFKRIGAVELETVSSEEDLAGALKDGFRIEASAWKGGAGTAIAADPQLSAFYSDFARHAAERGWLRLNFLRAGERRVAFDYSLEYQNRAYVLKLGYDAEWSSYAPSQLLLAMLLRKVFDQGLETYDFLGEFTEWKRAWAKESVSHCWLYVFSPGLLARFAHLAKFGVVPLIKKMLRKA